VATRYPGEGEGLEAATLYATLSPPNEAQALLDMFYGPAAMLLGGAQLAFLLGLEAVGWGLSLAVAAAAGVALAGFCVGCFFYYRYRAYRSRVFGKA
jgi:hypothetical protein